MFCVHSKRSRKLIIRFISPDKKSHWNLVKRYQRSQIGLMKQLEHLTNQLLPLVERMNVPYLGSVDDPHVIHKKHILCKLDYAKHRVFAQTLVHHQGNRFCPSLSVDKECLGRSVFRVGQDQPAGEPIILGDGPEGRQCQWCLGFPNERHPGE